LRAKKTLFSFFVFVGATLLHAGFEYRVENSNFTLSQGALSRVDDTRYLYNYDRLRFRGDFTQDSFFATLIGDGVNYYGEKFVESTDFEYVQLQKSDTPFATQSSYSFYENGAFYAKLYRAYGGYEDEKNRVVLGLQNITMGVGRIWTPTNLFNPRNTYALEPDETFGVFGLSYVRYLSDISQLTLVVSQKEDSSYKYALRYKGYFDFADIAFNTVSSDTTNMLGYEIEANLAQSGVEVRSEGAYIKSEVKKSLLESEDISLYQGIVGADYAFVNGITLTVEALYSSEKFSYEQQLLNYDSEVIPNLVGANFYTAVSLLCSFNIYLDSSLLYIESYDRYNSRYFVPTLTYTLNDYNSFMLGAMIGNGQSGSEFEKLEDSYYFKWFLSF